MSYFNVGMVGVASAGSVVEIFELAFHQVVHQSSLINRIEQYKSGLDNNRMANLVAAVLGKNPVGLLKYLYNGHGQCYIGITLRNFC